MYLRDPSGNLIELTQRDMTQVSRERVPLRVLADTFPQTAENLSATLYLYPQWRNEHPS